MFQDGVEGSCVDGNDDDLSCYRCGVRRSVTFNTVKTETYIVIVMGYQHSVGTFTLLIECHGSSYNNGVCEGNYYDYIDDETSDCLESCVDLCWYNKDYDYGNVDLDVVLCYYLCAEDVCGITF